MQTLKPLTLVTAIFALVPATTAEAAYKIDIQQVGPNVVASGSGSINLDALTFASDAGGLPAFAQVDPSSGLASVGAGNYWIYNGFTGPLSFGSGTGAFADSWTGVVTYIWGGTGELGVPPGYSSGTSLASTGTFNNSTLASLGLTPGTYIWSWGSGPSADTFTVQIENAAAVPESSTWAMMLLGFAGLGAALRRTRRTALVTT